ncbi:MAG: YwqG family protein [Pseudomonadota bacterium]
MAASDIEIDAAIKELEASCIRLVEAQNSTGTSFLGGLPQLHPDQEWPKAPEGTPLHFLAQIDCSQLPKFPQNPLPETGTLFFFGKVDEEQIWDPPGRWSFKPAGTSRVLYTDRAPSTEDRTAPTNLPPVHDGSNYYYCEPKWEGDWRFGDKPPHSVFPRLFVDPVQSVSYPVGDRVFRFYKDSEAFSQRSDELIESSMKAAGYSLVDNNDPSGERLLNHAMLGYSNEANEDGADEVLLLQLDSDHRIEWIWADVGMAQFWISEKNLRARKFNKAFGTVAGG